MISMTFWRGTDCCVALVGVHRVEGLDEMARQLVRRADVEEHRGVARDRRVGISDDYFGQHKCADCYGCGKGGGDGPRGRKMMR